MLGTVHHNYSLRRMKKEAEEFVKYGMTEAMMASHDHDGPSTSPSTQTNFERFSVIRILLLLGFCLYKYFKKPRFWG